MVKKLLRISKKSLYIPNILQMVSDKKNNNALKFSYSLKAINIEKDVMIDDNQVHEASILKNLVC